MTRLQLLVLGVHLRQCIGEIKTWRNNTDKIANRKYFAKGLLNLCKYFGAVSLFLSNLKVMHRENVHRVASRNADSTTGYPDANCKK